MHHDREPKLPYVFESLKMASPEAGIRPNEIVEVNAEGKETRHRFKYDDTGKLLRYDEESAGVIVSSEARFYDDKARLVEVFRERGGETQKLLQSYDEEDRLISRQYRHMSAADQPKHIVEETWQYDEGGRLVQSYRKSAGHPSILLGNRDSVRLTNGYYYRDVSFEETVTQYEYDENGNVLKETSRINRSDDPTLMKPQYFLHNHTSNPPLIEDPDVISEIEAWYRDNPLESIKTYKYKNGRLVHVAERGGRHSSDQFYDENTGLLIREEIGEAWDDGIVSIYEYDGQKRLIKSTYDDGQERIDTFHQYDSDGRWTEDYATELDGKKRTLRTCQYDDGGRPTIVLDGEASIAFNYAA